MISTKINFYNVGLNERNLAYNYTALTAILAAGIIKEGGQDFELSLTALPYGQIFNISATVYETVKSATYLKITNKDADDPNDTGAVRYGFINNFLQLANGNYSVSYTIDDWASFKLNPDSPYTLNLDGFTERANVPLYRTESGQKIIDTTQTPLSSNHDSVGQKYIFNYTRERARGVALPTGYKCAVYFINQPKYNGSPNPAADGRAYETSLTGNLLTLTDYDLKNKQFRTIPRNNTRLFYMVFDATGKNIALDAMVIVGGAIGYTNVFPAGQYTINEPNDESIEKIMYFDYLPTDTSLPLLYGYNSARDAVMIYNQAASLSDDTLKQQIADIYHTGNTYYKAPILLNFAPCSVVNINSLPGRSYGLNEGTFLKATNLNDFYSRSLYQVTDEFREIKIKFLTAELKIPTEFLRVGAKVYIGYSGDGETVTLKFLAGGTQPTDDNGFTATGQNINYFDLTIVRDFKAYKNAKITGAAGIAATAIGSIVALGASIGTSNVPGMIGALSGGAQGLISQAKKMQGLTPEKSSPANGDYTLTQIINNNDLPLTIEFVEELPTRRAAAIKYLEEYGAAVSMPLAEYFTACQMQAFNAIKAAEIDVTGGPQQICRRIEEIFLGGVTLWTATDVGNKRVINYPVE